MSFPEAVALVQLPEGAVPEGGITIMSYISADGHEQFVTQVHGEIRYSTLIGLMQMAAHALTVMCEADEDDDDE